MTNDARLAPLTNRLVEYFAAIGARSGHVFELRDINLQVMMNVFAPAERALLDAALDGLVADGMLLRVSATGCSLTAAGLARTDSLRSTNGRNSPRGLVERKDDSVAHGLPPTRGRRIPVTR